MTNRRDQRSLDAPLKINIRNCFPFEKLTFLILEMKFYARGNSTFTGATN